MVKDLKEPLQKLAIAKGQVTATLRILFDLCEMVGETPVNEEDGFTLPMKEENLGEVLYSLCCCLLPVASSLETTTNYLRKLEGLKPNDYSQSATTIFRLAAIAGIKETAKEMGYDLPEDGSPV